MLGVGCWLLDVDSPKNSRDATSSRLSIAAMSLAICTLPFSAVPFRFSSEIRINRF